MDFLVKSKKLLIVSCLFSSIETILWVNFAFVMSKTIDTIKLKSVDQYIKIAGIAILYIMIVRYLSFLFKKTSSKYSNMTLLYLRNKYIDYEYSRREIRIPADEISLLTNDLNIVKLNLFDTIPSVISNILSVILSSYFLLKISVKITVVIYIIVIILLIIPIFIKNLIKNKQIKVSNVNQKFINKIEDDFNGFDIIRSYNFPNEFKFETKKIATEICDSMQDFEIFNSGLGEFVHFFVTLLGVIGFIVGSYYVMKGNMSYGEMVAIVQLTNTLAGPLNQATENIPRMMGGYHLLKDVVSKLGKESKVINYNQPQFQDIQSITFRNVSLEVDGRIILDNISYTFLKNHRYLITGESGVGKTTLLRLIIFALPNYTGEILINNEDIRNFDRNIISKYIQYIEQAPYIFKASVGKNICLYNVEDKNRVKSILNQMKLGNLDPNGNCEGLSGGERQRISLARGIYNAKSVYLFDEVSSALDADNTKIVEKFIKSIDADIIISIAHKIDIEDRDNYTDILQIFNGKLEKISPK